MNHRERLEQTLSLCRDRIQEEVAALIGKPFHLGAPVFRLIDGHALGSEEVGSGRVFAPVRLDGEVEGMGLLLLRLRDALRIGGLLVMLPEVELRQAVEAEAWTEETADTFAEVAGIVCGALSAVFKEQFPRQVRFLAAGQQAVPAGEPVAAASLPAGEVLVLSLPMEAEGCDFGAFTLALPAAPFGLVAAGAATTPAEAVDGDAEFARPDGDADTIRADGAAWPAAVDAPERPDNQRLARRVMADCLARTADAVGNLLGGSLRITPERQLVLDRQEALAQAGGLQVLARLTVRGEGEGEGCVLTDLPTAAALGGSLLMLPEHELAAAMGADRLDPDLADGFAEVVTVIAGACTAVFAEQDRVARLGFDRGPVETAVPDRRTLPASGYCLAAGRVSFAGRDLGRLQLLVPASLLGVELPELSADAALEEAERSTGAGPEATVTASETAEKEGSGPGCESDPPPAAEVVLFSDDRGESERILAMLAEMGCTGRVCHFKDPVQGALAPGVRMVVLVMGEVSEQGFGVAIKLASAGLRAPLVAAAPAWTRTLVLQAVKYGVRDILVTPVTAADLRQRMAAAPEHLAA
ncbi:hypothetical protein [uncultured Desulfobulbus sp.]|uniref:hypothetical protein n=1 Tax=uncultured Desulfobulbus sp. TaxID=239745 RepID=UPI00262340AC|nr:hypothetical protein [uncultured Desulfobulbus sp.]